ncbi:hypothetical protein KDW54_21145, partial [Burkholderia ambifaria]|uniref:hypothetical protein n=1 Tax=Burkholderia ambifaria TaxID=152480 RepID=UPI001B9E3227
MHDVLLRGGGVTAAGPPAALAPRRPCRHDTGIVNNRWNPRRRCRPRHRHLRLRHRRLRCRR